MYEAGTGGMITIMIRVLPNTMLTRLTRLTSSTRTAGPR
jgi:hypothetical protein